MRYRTHRVLAFFILVSLTIFGCTQSPSDPDLNFPSDREGFSQIADVVTVKFITYDAASGEEIATGTMTNIPGCEAVIIRDDDIFDRVCGDDDWVAFPDHLQFCDEPIYYQNDDGKVAICAAEDCDLTLGEQFELYQYASGTSNLPGDGV